MDHFQSLHWICHNIASCFFFFFGCQTCGVLAPWPGIEPASLCTGSWSSSPGPPGKSLELFRRQQTECLERGAWWDVHTDLCLLQYLEDFPFSEIWASSFVCIHHHPVHGFCLSSSWAFFFSFQFSSQLFISFSKLSSNEENYLVFEDCFWMCRQLSDKETTVSCFPIAVFTERVLRYFYCRLGVRIKWAG